jgi:serine/threonine-protein kinase
MDFAPSVVIAGRYRVGQRIAAGGMGEVWNGEHVGIGMKVALKRLLPKVADEPEIVARFRREAQLIGRVHSAHVARVVDFLEDPTYGLVLVLEFIDGERLTDRMVKGRISVEEAIDLGVDITSALADLHRANIVHRDLKPGNILLQTLRDGSRRAVIVDFGVSRLVGDEADDADMTNITEADTAVGTLEYMAPEQVLSAKSVTPASDIYAVGAILYRAVAGHHVFPGLKGSDLAKAKVGRDPPPLVTGREVPVARGFEAVVARSLRRRMGERFQRAEDMRTEISVLRDVARMTSEVALDKTTPEVILAATELTSRDRISYARSAEGATIEDPSTHEIAKDAPKVSTAPPAAPSPASVPATPDASVAPPTPSARAAEATPTRSEPSPSPVMAPPPRRGMAVGLVVAAVLVAAVCGVALGAALTGGTKAPASATSAP